MRRVADEVMAHAKQLAGEQDFLGMDDAAADFEAIAADALSREVSAELARQWEAQADQRLQAVERAQDGLLRAQEQQRKARGEKPKAAAANAVEKAAARLEEARQGLEAVRQSPPPDMRFSLRSDRPRITPEQDAEYLAAVEAGDMDAAQRMVDEAARAAGYGVGPVWHGTDAQFSSFRRGKRGIFFTSSRDEAERYAQIRTHWNNRESIVGRFYLRADRIDREDLFSAEERGFDAFAEGHMWVVFDPSQAKSADPVTYDDAGNPVPLSQRFDESRDDIRFSLREDGQRAMAAVERSIPPGGNQQALNEFDELFDQAEESFPGFRAFMRAVADEFGSATYGPRIKGRERARGKMVPGVDQPRDLRDLVAGTIVHPDIGRLYRVIEALAEGRGIAVVRAKDRIAEPIPTGYRDILLNLRMDNGFVAELQLNVPQMIEAKEGLGHKLYELQRSLKEEHIRAALRLSDPLEADRLDDLLLSTQRKFYDAAWEAGGYEGDSARALANSSALLSEIGAALAQAWAAAEALGISTLEPWSTIRKTLEDPSSYETLTMGVSQSYTLNRSETIEASESGEYKVGAPPEANWRQAPDADAVKGDRSEPQFSLRADGPSQDDIQSLRARDRLRRGESEDLFDGQQAEPQDGDLFGTGAQAPERPRRPVAPRQPEAMDLFADDMSEDRGDGQTSLFSFRRREFSDPAFGTALVLSERILRGGRGRVHRGCGGFRRDLIPLDALARAVSCVGYPAWEGLPPPGLPPRSGARNQRQRCPWPRSSESAPGPPPIRWNRPSRA